MAHMVMPPRPMPPTSIQNAITSVKSFMKVWSKSDIVAQTQQETGSATIVDSKTNPSPCNPTALGHVRLSINDLSPSAAQPFHSPPSHGIHAVVNGEFYDYDSIRAHLESVTSYTFTSRSDSEIIIALYLHYGLNFTDWLRGEFACVLWDEKQELFVAVRDRYGIKPLFWTVQNGRLLVAAEQKAFLPLGWQPEWDVRALRDAGWNHDTRTLFKGVQKIRPGHYITYQSFGQVDERPYWDMSFPNKHLPDPRTPEEAIEG
ncbi:asparagine synthase, partial [Hortaea werneckii]